MSEMPAGYDAWKTDPGWGEPPDEECYHDGYEIGINGRAHCDRCGESWWPTDDEIRWQREANEAYDKHCAREDRREAWRELRQRWFWRPTLPVRLAINRLLVKVGLARKVNVIRIDDEVPF